MRQSVLFSRFFSVVILAILITALFTTIFYNYISRTVFTTIKENELLPKAKALGSIVQNFREGTLDKGALKQLLAVENVDSSLLGAYVLVTDENMNTLLINENLPQGYFTAMREGAKSVLTTGQMQADQILRQHGGFGFEQGYYTEHDLRRKNLCRRGERQLTEEQARAAEGGAAADTLLPDLENIFDRIEAKLRGRQRLILQMIRELNASTHTIAKETGIPQSTVYRELRRVVIRCYNDDDILNLQVLCDVFGVSLDEAKYHTGRAFIK
jgi:hypothetical protein